MVKKPRRMRTFARTASKSMEKKLIQNAKKIKENPFLVIPEYEDSDSEKYFGKLKKKIDKINSYTDDSKKLDKLSNKRDIRGAVAGTLLLAHSEKAPYLAVGKFPTGDVAYAQRGKADKEKLIAVQHFDDPVLRILGIKDISLKKKLYVYSWDKGFFSSGKKPNPPNGFVDFVLKKTNLKRKENTAICENLDPKIVKEGKNAGKSYLRIYWKSADILIGICEKCASKQKNILFNITKYMIEPDLEKDFEISVVGKAYKGIKSEENETIKIDDYLSGKIKDYDFIKQNIKTRKQKLKDSSEKIFILNGDSYGKDKEGFIKALDPNEYEKIGLEFVLDKIDEPIVFDDATPNKILEEYWGDFGLEIIESIIKDKDMAEKFYSLDDEPSDILELAFNYKKRRKILSNLPKYKSLPKLAEFADKIARNYKTFGEKKTLVELRNIPDDTKMKSLTYAFLLAFNRGKDKKWKYSEVEIEYGNFLKEYAKKLLRAKPDEYHTKLKDLLTASGYTKDLDEFLYK